VQVNGLRKMQHQQCPGENQQNNRHSITFSDLKFARSFTRTILPANQFRFIAVIAINLHPRLLLVLSELSELDLLKGAALYG